MKCYVRLVLVLIKAEEIWFFFFLTRTCFRYLIVQQMNEWMDEYTIKCCISAVVKILRSNIRGSWHKMGAQ